MVLSQQKNMPVARRWQKAIGPVAALVTMLLEQGWDPEQPDRWKSPDGDWFEMSDGALDHKALKQAFVEQCQKTELQRTAKGHLGKGMDEGIYWQQARAHLRRLKKQEGGAKQAGLLQKVMAGGMWTRCRSQAHGYQMPTTACVLCGAPEQDNELHRT